ncbi:MAG: hypothetical protein HPY69_08300 [Armatimonadetes bacterium]|nr:hypothetical protein [Armatimonadota bacterium]
MLTSVAAAGKENLRRVALMAVLTLALLLRLHGLRHLTYAGPDEGLWAYFIVNNAQLPWLSADLASSALGRIMSWDYGWPMFVGWDAYVRLLASLGIGVNEFTLALPMVLCGVGVCYLVFLAGRRLVGEAGALLASLLVAVMPHAVTWSRTIGGSVTFNSLLLLMAIIALMRYVEAPGQRRRQWVAGLAVGLYLCGDVQFAIGAVILLGLLALGPRPAGYEGSRGLARLVLRPTLFVPPVVMFLPYVAAYAYACRLGYPDQTYLGTVLAEHKARWGFHLMSFASDLWFNAGLLLMLGLTLIPRGLRQLAPEYRRWLSLWLALTAAPFLFAMTREVTLVTCYHNHLLVAVALLVASGVMGLRQAGLRTGLATVLSAGTLLATFACVYQVQPLQGVLWPRLQAPYGAMAPETGLKAAGYWVRTRLHPTDRVFVAHDPALAFWYFGRECVTGGYTAADPPPRAFLEHRNDVCAAVVTAATPYPPGIFTANGFPGLVTVRSKGKPVAWVHVREHVEEVIDAQTAAPLYNAAFRTPAQIIRPGSPYVPGRPLPGRSVPRTSSGTGPSR